MLTTNYLDNDFLYRILTKGTDLRSAKNATFLSNTDGLEVDIDHTDLTMDELRQNFSSFVVIQDGAEVSHDAFNPNFEALALRPIENGHFQVFVARV